jgi:hypothetical protein
MRAGIASAARPVAMTISGSSSIIRTVKRSTHQPWTTNSEHPGARPLWRVVVRAARYRIGHQAPAE